MKPASPAIDSSHLAANPAPASPAITLRTFISICVRVQLFFLLLGGIIFGAAGRLDLPAVWAYMGIFMLAGIVNATVIWKTDPTLIHERLRPGPGGKDPHLRGVEIAILLAHWVVAGLDIGRYHWSDTVPPAVQVAALASTAGAFALTIWAVRVNRFFSSDARIQRDRGHQVVTAGPYAYIRHPGYASAILMMLASPFALGSYVSGILVLPGAAMILRRLFLEERLLLAELEGYAEYARKVRFRFVPGLW